MKTALVKILVIAAIWGTASSFNIQAQTYTFTTIAGNAGFGSADGTGSAARFNGPMGLAFDSAGNLFVTDSGNQTIRKLTPAGANWLVTTIAGSAAVSGSANGTNAVARFNNPSGITVDSAGNIFATDAGNATIRKIAPSGANWVVTTLAGLAENPGSDDGTNSVARFSNPLGVVTEASGIVLVADSGNNTLRKLSPSGPDWIVTTIAGDALNPGAVDGTNTVALFNGPLGMARSGTNVYVVDSSSHIIRRLTSSGANWITTTIAGLAGVSGNVNGTNSAARFSSPVGIAADPAGNLFVSEYGNNTIRKLAPSGTNWIVTTIAGQANTIGSADGTNNTARFYQPFGVAADTNGNVFVADQANNTIRKITPSGADWITTTIAGQAGGGPGNANGTNFAARFNSPYQAAVDGAGNVYVADSGNNRIRKLAKLGPDWVVTTIAGSGSGTSDGTNTEAQFFGPYGLAMDAQTNLYIADLFNFAIRKISPDGPNWITKTIAGQIGLFSGYADGTNTDARFEGPEGIAADASGNLFVADTFGHTIRKITKSGTDWITVTIAGQSGVSVPADGTNMAAHFNYPVGVAVDGSNNVFIADGNTVRKMTPSGTNWIVTTIAGVAGVSGSDDGTNQTALFGQPFGLAVAPDGSLIVTDLGNNTVRKITRAGTNWITTTIGGTAGIYGVVDGVGDAARFPGVLGVTVNSSGQIFLFTSSTAVLGEPSSIISPNPTLQIFPLGKKVVLYWPSSASNFNLETTSPLRPSATWTNLPGATLSGLNYWFTNSATSSAAFFRLHQP